MGKTFILSGVTYKVGNNELRKTFVEAFSKCVIYVSM